MVSVATTVAISQAPPEVSTAGAANIGVSHKNVVPKRKSAIPPRFRILIMVAFPRPGRSTPLPVSTVRPSAWKPSGPRVLTPVPFVSEAGQTGLAAVAAVG